MKVCVVAGDNPHYVHSWVKALARSGVQIDLIGDDRHQKLRFPLAVTLLNLRGSRDPEVSLLAKTRRIICYYARCLAYMWNTDSTLVHVQGFRFPAIEGLILLRLYRIFGKTIIYTAHDLQPKGRHDALTYFLFYIIYRNVDHVVCHTAKMKTTLLRRYRLSEKKVSVIRHGLNVSVPIHGIGQREARRRLSIDPGVRVFLIFGKIQRYKGIDIALEALKRLPQREQVVLCLVGGGSDSDKAYLKSLKDYIDKENLQAMVRLYTDFIPDKDVEIFFRSADLLLLPYREGDFQSGVLFLAYRFNLPVIVSDVGSLPEDVEIGVTGLVFRSENPADLAGQIEHYYQRFHSLPEFRRSFRTYVRENYNWDNLARATTDVYKSKLGSLEGLNGRDEPIDAVR